MFEGFVFPAPILGNRAPTISDGWHMRSSGKMHEGVDIMYPRNKAIESATLPNGTTNYYLPNSTPALAAGPGVVTISKDIGTGGYVRILHDNSTISQYMHLAPRMVLTNQRVSAGDAVGIIGYDVSPGAYRLMHLHFELLVVGFGVLTYLYVNA